MSFLGRSAALAKDRTTRALAWGPGLWALALMFAVLILGPLAMGVCGCTMFSLGAGLMVLATSLLVGNTAFGALTGEREKKTLDSLRLTQLSSVQIILAKLLPEFRLLGRLVGALAPTVVLAALLGGQGLFPALQMVAIALAGGALSATMAVCVSSLFDTTSRAVVAGWTLKAVWLLVTPVLDLVLGAVLVQDHAVPALAFVNPLTVGFAALVPEANFGLAGLLPWLGPVAMTLAAGLCFFVAARRFEDGLSTSASLTDRVVHPVYRRGWGPVWLQRAFPGLRRNPAFLREMAIQIRSGGARWPGYAVFIVLFLAPLFYAHSWAVKETVRQAMSNDHHAPLTVVHEDDIPRVVGDRPELTPADTSPLQGRRVLLEAWGGKQLMLKGHTECGCLRLALYERFQVPLPRDSVMEVAYTVDNQWGSDPKITPAAATPIDDSTAAQYGIGMAASQPSGGPAVVDEHEVNVTAMAVGMAGTVVLLLLYLAIRCSGFMTSSVTGERDRKTWEDLALTGITPERALSGRLLGSILLMAFQMTVAFPVLGLFVLWGSLGAGEVFRLYVYALAVILTAATVGLWASATSKTSHQAQGRALLVVLIGFFLAPGLVMGLGGVLGWVLSAGAVLASLVLLGTGRRAEALGMAGIAFGVLVTPLAAFPVSATISFMPSVLNANSPILSLFPSVPTQLALEPSLAFIASLVFMLSLALLLWSNAMRRLADAGGALKAELSRVA